MAEVVKMPRLSDTMTEGVVATWHKSVGDKVSEGDLLAEIETDKATMEFDSFQEGVLLHIGVQEGEAVPVESIIAILGEEGEDIEAILKAESAESTESTAPVVEESAPVEAKVEAPKAEKVALVNMGTTSIDGRVKASPLAKKMAADKGINLSTLQGSGDGGRVIKRDIDNYVVPAAAVGTVMGQESYTDEPVSQMRKIIAKRLAESKFTAPHFYLTVSIDMDNAIASRKMMNNLPDTKISFNDLVVKASALALKQHPSINSSWLGDTIRRNDHVHIGIAVAVDEGLLVPVVRFTDTKSLSQIGTEVRDLAGRAKDKKLQPADWEGNTFTISNLGMFGIEEFTAIVNPPDACILAVGGISQVPVVKNGQVVPGNIMKVTLSCDHRVVDGASGAAFLNTLKSYMENPVTMLA